MERVKKINPKIAEGLRKMAAENRRREIIAERNRPLFIGDEYLMVEV